MNAESIIDIGLYVILIGIAVGAATGLLQASEACLRRLRRWLRGERVRRARRVAGRRGGARAGRRCGYDMGKR